MYNLFCGDSIPMYLEQDDLQQPPGKWRLRSFFRHSVVLGYLDFKSIIKIKYLS